MSIILLILEIFDVYKISKHVKIYDLFYLLILNYIFDVLQFGCYTAIERDARVPARLDFPPIVEEIQLSINERI